MKISFSETARYKRPLKSTSKLGISFINADLHATNLRNVPQNAFIYMIWLDAGNSQIHSGHP